MPRRSADPGQIRRATADLPPIAAGLTTPLQHMLAVINDPDAPASRRDKMAVAAAPYCHARKADAGKKQQQAETAQRAGDDTEWAGDLAGDWQQ